MGGLSRIRGFLDYFRDSVYDERASETLDRLGIREPLAEAYWWTRLTLASPQTYRADGTAATFLPQSRSDFFRLEDFMGEEYVIERVLNDVRSGDVFYDVGSHIGTYACFVASHVDDCEVVAFEPHPETCDSLIRNLGLNDADATVCRYALSDAAGEAELSVTSDKTSRSGNFSLLDSGGSGVNVRKIRGDDLVADENLPSPTVVKVDVEGAEMAAIDGLAETLGRPECRVVYCEVHPTYLSESGYDEQDVESALTELGFEVEPVYDRNEETFLRAEK